jgi:hypothetical protein
MPRWRADPPSRHAARHYDLAALIAVLENQERPAAMRRAGLV